jgi:hypothetical protein
METSTISSAIKKLSYEERKDLYSQTFSVGLLSNSIGKHSVNDKLILISLLSLTYIKMREKNPKITVLEILLNILKQKADNSCFYQMLESLAILVEDFAWECSTADACGLKTSQEIVTKIKEIISTWMPF